MGVASATRAIGEADVRAMLAFVGELNSLERPDDFREGVLPGIRELVPCEIASYNEVDFSRSSMIARADPDGSMFDGATELFVRLGHQNPLVAAYQRTRDGRPYKWSDLITRRELHATDLYREVYALMDVEYQMAFCLPAPPGLIIAFALNRGRRDFSERERTLLNLIRAPMIQALRTVQRYAALSERLAALERGLEQRGAGLLLLEGSDGGRVVTFASDEAVRSLSLDAAAGQRRRVLPELVREWLAEAGANQADGPHPPLLLDRPDGSRVAVHLLPARDAGGRDALLLEPIGELLSIEGLRGSGLTQREAEVMRLVGLGRSNSEIAAELAVSTRTVHKHLQHAYDKLGAASRTQAVRAAWSIAMPAAANSSSSSS